MTPGRLEMKLELGGRSDAEVVVLGVEGREGLSEPFRFAVDFVPAEGQSVALAGLVRQEALLRIARPSGEERLVHGEAARVELLRVAADRPAYRVTIEPRLTRLEQAARSRVYQGKTVPEIAQAVLGEHRVVVRTALRSSYPPREYAVQYRETDLHFLSRLLEEVGIWYRFEHAEQGHTLVLCDDPSGFSPTGLKLRVREETSQGSDLEFVQSIARARGAVAGRVVRRDYDFTRPGADLTVQAEEADDLEVYEWPGGYREVAEGTRGARARLEELRFGEETWRAVANALAAEPGSTLTVEGAGDLAVIRVLHRAAQEGSAGHAQAVIAQYENAFLAIAAGRPYRAPRRFARPSVRGIATATVVGPSGEEIETDPYGRLRVKFHWDREGRRDDTASCFVRLAQAWAGPGMGGLFLPRVGQEVVVRFLEGDPDRPLVMGAVYNGANGPPLELPGEKTRSTQRTATTPGSSGSNELRLEDASGSEEVFRHAQKDEATVVENDRAIEVRRDELVEVARDRTQEVSANQDLRVELLDQTEVGRDQALTVTRDRSTTVALAHEEEVAGNQTIAVSGNRYLQVFGESVTSVGAAATLNVGGAYTVNVAGLHNQAVGGLKSTQVAGASVEWVGATRRESIGSDRTSSVGGDLAVQVDGALALGTRKDAAEDLGGAEGIEAKERVAAVAQKMELVAEDRLSIVVGGKVALVIDSSGQLTFSGGAITVDGSELKLKGSQIAKVASGAAPSQKVEVAALKTATDPRAFALFALVDQDGEPVLNEPFQVELPDGSVKHGRTDGHGRAAVPGTKPGTAKVTFTHLDGRSVEEE